MHLSVFKKGQIILGIIFLSFNGFGQSIPAYKNEKLALDARVFDLVSKLSLEEKVSLLGYNSKEFLDWAFQLIIGGTSLYMEWHAQVLLPFFRNPLEWRLVLMIL